MRKKNILPLFGILAIVGLIVFCWAAFEPILRGSLVSYGNYSTTINFSCANNMTNPLNASFLYNTTGGATGTYLFTMANTTTNQSVFENATVNILTLVDGRNYNITCLMTNGTSTSYSFSVSNVTFDSTPPAVNFTNIINTVNNSNYSGTIVVNVSASDAIMGINYVFFNITNSTGTQVSFTKTSNSTTGPFYNASVNTSLLADGLYNITVYANDTQLNNLNSSAKIQIRIDNTPPRSLPVYVIGIANWTNYSGSIVLNVTGVNDPTSGIGVVDFQISNATGSLNNTFASSSVNGSWNATFNTASLGDGVYNITYLINDSAGNQNSSVAMYNIIFDNTAPTVLFSCSSHDVYRDDSLTCSCSGADATAGVNSTSYVIHPDTSLTGLFYPSCTIIDTAGNYINSTYYYDVMDVPGPTSSSGSSGSSTAVVASNNQLFAQIIPATPQTATGFANNSGVDQIQISVSQTANNVKVQVDSSDSKPSAVSVEKSNTYKYLHVITQNLADKLSQATIKIQVEKSWVSSEGIDKADVALFRYNENTTQWNQLTTTFNSEDSSYYYYTIDLNSFSYFAIASAKVVQPATNNNPSTTTSGTQTTNTGISIWVWVGTGVVVLLIVAFIIFKKTRKK